MRIINQYIADDGKVFDNAADCAEYEMNARIAKYANDILFFDNDTVKLSGDIERCYNNARFVYISPNVEDMGDVSHSIYNYYGITLPTKSGVWVYNDDTDKWESLDQQIETLRKAEKLIEKIHNQTQPRT